MSDTLATPAPTGSSTAPLSAPEAPSPRFPATAQPRATPGSPEWAEMTLEQRHEQLRGPPNPRSVGHSPARDQREAASARAAGEAAPPAPDAPALNAEKVKIGRYEVSEAELATMMDRQAHDDLRKANVPPTPDAYKLEISPNAKLPGGLEIRFDGTDPGLVAAKAWAHAKGLDQSAFSEMLTLYASHVTQQEAALAERSRAEIAKAGVNAPQRVDAIDRWIRAEVGDADAKPIIATLVTDAHLRFYEKMLQRITSQGTAPFSQSHRVAPEQNKIPGYENMSFEQRRHAQEQLVGRRR
jgi:hypothetical protein